MAPEGDVAGNGLVLTDLTSPLVRELHRYWNEIKGDRRWPAKRDFDPAAVRRLLPYLTIEEVHRDPLRIRFRLVGTEQARFAGLDYTGCWLHELPWHPAVIQDLLGQYRRLLAAGEPVFGASRYSWADGFEKSFEWGLFPFGDGGDRIDHVLGIEDFSGIDRERLERLLEGNNGKLRHARPMAAGGGQPKPL
ncbi:PAS domain-containing protein [Dongia mobilis]|uniref:PAS domain-containing protein n=1 Tax=Dongia mobilis TaxID=578943 RepID=A0A4R6WPS6_9PROT|nr:PAS domain-containing protein [Dongia mobilis]TDQ81489.1 PAS domain-containing protein [Dongia mobilis]